MNWVTEHYLDIISVLLIIIITFSGYKKGILRMVISLAGFIAAAALAVFISNSTYEYVYFHIVRPSVMEYIESEAENLSEEYSPEKLLKEFNIPNIDDTSDDNDLHLTNEQLSGKLNSIFKEYCTRLTESLKGVIPDEIIESADNYLEKNSIDEKEAVSSINDSRESVISIIEAEVIRPVMLKTVKNVIFFTTFIIVSIIFSILSRVVGIIRKLELIKVPDSFLGAILGFIYSVLTVMTISLLCSIFIGLTANENSVLNTGIIEKTYLFKYFNSLSFVLLAALLI